METLAYLHLALDDEAPIDASDSFTLNSLKLFDWLKPCPFATQTRMYWLSLLLVLSIVGLAGEALAQRTLKVGDRGPDVTFIQERLRQLRYFNRPSDGVFGSATRDAVIQFQRDYHLVPDGTVGPTTESALFAEFEPRTGISSQSFSSRSRFDERVLQQGDRGADVTAVQQRLRELRYFRGTPTGYFGSSTQEAVTRFQMDQNINANGIVDSQTRAALFGSATTRFYSEDLLSLPPPPQPSGDFSSERYNENAVPEVLRYGSSGAAVERLQQRLRQKGYNPGRVDGVFGSQTESAVRQFQRANDLTPDGIVGAQTLMALGIPGAERNRYVVVVPIRDSNTLNQVRAVAGFADASLAESSRGKYVYAGAFSNRASAESRSYFLRSQGLDARVAYSP
ncbi:MAG TPA: peptidoglycan-binding protein [Waterburya sp.]|jgi:peptidoglycan hydrolase-like protein with peptidoglycan-binding domain